MLVSGRFQFFWGICVSFRGRVYDICFFWSFALSVGYPATLMTLQRSLPPRNEGLKKAPFLLFPSSEKKATQISHMFHLNNLERTVLVL